MQVFTRALEPRWPWFRCCPCLAPGQNKSSTGHLGPEIAADADPLFHSCSFICLLREEALCVLGDIYIATCIHICILHIWAYLYVCIYLNVYICSSFRCKDTIYRKAKKQHSEEQGKGGTCVPGLVGCFARFSASLFAALSLLLGLMSPWAVTETW